MVDDLLLEIIEVDYGIGSTYHKEGKTIIQINKNLRKYPELHDYVIAHELEHARSKKSIDFITEIKDTFNYKKGYQLVKFMIKHPRAFSSLCPILITKECIMIDWFKIIVYSIILLLAGVILIL